jgi:hypothetical protein
MVRRNPPQGKLFLIRRVLTLESNPTFRHEFANRQEPVVGIPVGLVFIVMLTILGPSRKELKLCPCEKAAILQMEVRDDDSTPDGFCGVFDLESRNESDAFEDTRVKFVPRCS